MALLAFELPRIRTTGFLCLALDILGSFTVVSAQLGRKFDLDPISNFCSKWWSHSVVKNDILYIDSGVQKWNGTDITTPIIGINSYMITIPLNTTWDWKTNITVSAQAKNATSPTTGTLPPSQIRGHMFHGPSDKAEVYVYGGTTYMGNQSFNAYTAPDAAAYHLWSYTYGPNYPWGQYAGSTAWMPNHGAGAEAIDQGLGFYLNGQVDWGTSSRTLDTFPKTESLYMPVKGMVVLDLNTQTSKNISTAKLGDGATRVGGSMEYLPSVGRMGALVALGGQIQPNLTEVYADVSKGKLIDFSTVDVFDINSYLEDPSSNGTWYSQKTTGDVPPPRIDFCTVAISAPDNSSHHIYLYGGVDPINNTGFDDVVILTIPSFTWTNVWPIGEAPRWGHNCHVAGKRQMITVGGNNTNGLTCDWEVKGVGVFDMSTLTWGSVFLSNLTEFQIPTRILPLTGGTVNGKATIKEPALGWTDSGLKTVFSTSRKAVTPSPSATPSATPSPSSSKTNIGAIAGGVVGGVALLIFLAVLAIFLRRRRHKRRGPHELHNTSASPTHNELDTEKNRPELPAVNENEPAELFTEIPELESPREAVEADPLSSTSRAELPGTSTAPGALHGIPIVRTPGDELPELPLYVPGLRRPSVDGVGEADGGDTKKGDMIAEESVGASGEDKGDTKVEEAEMKEASGPER